MARSQEAVALLGAAGTLCLMRSPQQTQRLLDSCRVALFDGPIAAPLTQTPDSAVDLVIVDWQAVAEQLRQNLSARSLSGSGEQIIFRAEARLRVSLNALHTRPLQAAA
jgi:uncharacterized protein YccT (UPF0319 family)